MQRERSKAKLYEVPGNSQSFVNAFPNVANAVNLSQQPCNINVTQIDQDYQMIDVHIEETVKCKIQSFEYMDFSKLLTENKVVGEEDQCLEIVNRNGMTYLSPISDRDAVSISSYNKWEQAFRVYSNILTSKHPGKATELLQYNHTIHTASMSYQWDNVYAYDKEFRHHISRHPYRSWTVILQQAWTMLLKDRIRNDNSFFHKGQFSGSSSGRVNKKDKEPCRRFNKGRCTYSLSCKFDHRCLVKKCGKFSHGAHQCQVRLQQENTEHTNTTENGNKMANVSDNK